MPDRLHLDKRLDPPGALAGLGVEEIDGLGLGAFAWLAQISHGDSLYVFGRALAEGEALLGHDSRGVDGVDVAVTRDDGDELGAVAGEQVHDAAGDVARRPDLAE